MKRIALYLTLALILVQCTKEVQIDIPGFEEQLVIDGRIETDMPPIVLLSKSKEVYAPTDLNAFLNGFITGADVKVSNGTTEVTLDEICSDNLPPGFEAYAAALLGIPVDSLANYHICAYTTANSAMFGEVGKTYTLTVNYEGKTYTGETSIVNPTLLDKVYWKPDGDLVQHGWSWATLSDPANQYDAYMWEVKRLDGANSDPNFMKTYAPYFDDDFFDGLTFDFYYENPFTDDSSYPDSVRWYYELGDTVVIKLSKMDRDVFSFFEKKMMQLQTAGNPFATPTNIPSNIEGGALGVWAGYSPSYDTLICLP